MGGCPGLASWLPCLRVAAELAAPASLQAWLALLLALAALCLLLGTERRAHNVLCRLLVESGASLVGDSKPKRRPSHIPLRLGELWCGALLAACTGKTL